jgi:ribose 5-phosphate isomerase RpiB
MSFSERGMGERENSFLVKERNMKIAVISEVSAVIKNPDIMAALEGHGHKIINAGMKSADDKPELTYIQTGLLAGLLLGTNRVDMVVGGCGTGLGFLNSALQYPKVMCGLISNDLDAWLFGKINGGNCISLPLLVGYGWAGDINLKFIFDKLFSVTGFGKGYPPHREESQQQSRKLFSGVSDATHKPLEQIISNLEDDVIKPVLAFPGVLPLLDIDSLPAGIRDAIKRRI